MRIGRRGFFQVAAVTAGTGLLAGRAEASGAAAPSDGPAVLVDTTRCVGCRACEAACAEKNELPSPPASDDVLDGRRDMTTDAFTVVNRAEGPDGQPRFAKKQCMHCLSPACASACPVRALDKQPEGPVTYDPSRCMGCRYCMVACPFEVPKYEYQSRAPRVRKCSFCFDRQQAGLAPACASVCPSGALTFGRRGELLDEAKRRIYAQPGRYQRHVYGEHEAGGTSWLYLADVDFAKLALADGVPERSYPELVSGALGAPPMVMTLWPPLLMGLYAFSKRREQAARDGEAEAHHDPKEDGHA
jgi:Fe-S-cluster-containing dehydrogenase component